MCSKQKRKRIYRLFSHPLLFFWTLLPIHTAHSWYPSGMWDPPWSPSSSPKHPEIQRLLLSIYRFPHCLGTSAATSPQQEWVFYLCINPVNNDHNLFNACVSTFATYFTRSLILAAMLSSRCWPLFSSSSLPKSCQSLYLIFLLVKMLPPLSPVYLHLADLTCAFFLRQAFLDSLAKSNYMFSQVQHTSPLKHFTTVLIL